MIEAKVYYNGTCEVINVTNINKEDADYINEHNIKVSMEELNGQYVVYFDDGTLLDDGETPNEIIVLNRGRSCEECMAEGVELLKTRRKEKC